MRPENAQAARLYDAVTEASDPQTADDMLSALPISKSPSEARRHQWAREACRAIDERFPGKSAENIRRACHCHPPASAVRRLRRMWDDSADVAAFCKAASNDAARFEPAADDGTLIMIYPRCYCAFVKRAAEPLPLLWCACTLGYTEALFHEITGKEARAELLESVVSGGAVCRIRVTF